MPKKTSYRDYLKQEMNGLIDQVELSDLQKRFMKGRWLDQLLWLEGRATKSRNRYYMLRLLTIIGGVIVPALVSVNSANVREDRYSLREIFGWTAFGLSQVVAISAAVEELFHYGESYRRYRNTAEGMKIEGWQFFQLSGPYSNAANHTDAYTTFAANIEGLIQKDVEGYVSQSVQSEAAVQANMQALIAQNTALATAQLQEQLRQPPPIVSDFSDSTPLDENQYSPEVWQEDNEEDFVTSDQLQTNQFSELSETDSDDEFVPASAMGNLTPFPTHGSPIVATEEDDDDFVTPAQLQGTPLGGTTNGGGSITTNTVISSTTLVSNSVVVAQEDDDDFVTPDQLRGITNSLPVIPITPAPNPAPSLPAPTPTKPPLATPEVVADILKCPLSQTQTYLPCVLAALEEKGILDRLTLIGAIATIGVETGGFRPINEMGGNQYFTKMYEGRKTLGNTRPGDGARYHGRGFIQITGRANYRDYGQKLGLGSQLEDNPELTLDPTIAARILACYFYDRKVHQAARASDWRKVRKLVNGGYNGWEEFNKFVQRALQKI